MQNFYKIQTSFPVEKEINYFLNQGHEEQGYIMLNQEEIFNSCSTLAKISQLLKNSDPIGRIGNYRAVYELGMGIECYTPDNGSNPGQGTIGMEEYMRVITFVTYCNPKITNMNQVENFINKVAEAHPWEHPVIQFHHNGNIKLYTKDNT